MIVLNLNIRERNNWKQKEVVDSTKPEENLEYIYFQEITRKIGLFAF